MERIVPKSFEYLTPSLNNTSDLMNRLSSLNMTESSPPKNAQAEHNRKTEHCQRNSNMTEHYQRNLLNNTLHHRTRRATRGNLPKSATNILKDWLLRNWHDPYPTEDAKDSLAKATGLKLEQVNNWLINARRRLLPGICHKYGLDHSKCKIAKRGGNRGGLVLGKTEEIRTDGFSLSWVAPDECPSPNDVTYKIVLKVPDSPEHPSIMLDYLADVMLVNEELEKQPNDEGLSRQELLCRRGLGERLYTCSS